jgi:hypothetical protein
MEGTVEGVVVVAAIARCRHPAMDVVDEEGVVDGAARAVLRRLLRRLLHRPLDARAC